MIVPGMSMEVRLAHARADLKCVQNKFDRQWAKMERALRVSRDKLPRIFQADYISPARNNWMITVRVTKKRTTMFAVVWWHFEETGLEALTVNPSGSSFYFDSHFFQRYRGREVKVVHPHENMRLFFRRNYDITMKMLDTYRYGLREAAGVAVDGLFLGTVRPGEIVACDTYYSQDMLREDQVELQREIRLQAHGRTLSPVQLQQMRKWHAELLRMLEDLDSLE